MVAESAASSRLGAAGTRGAAGAEISEATVGTEGSIGSASFRDEVPCVAGEANGIDAIEAAGTVGVAGAALVVSWISAETGVEAMILVLDKALRAEGTSVRGSVRSQPPSVARKGESQLTL